MSSNSLSSVFISVSPIYERAVRRLQGELEARGCRTRYLGRADEGLPAAELLELLQDAEIYLVGNAPVPRPVIHGASRLALISKFGVGVDNIDLAAATERGVLVTNAPGSNAIAVAEMTLGLLIALSRRLKDCERVVGGGHWRVTVGDDLCGRTLGIVGLGNIGKQVAVLARAFGMRVLANDLVDYADFCLLHQVEAVTLDQLLAQADLLTLHVPLTPLTRHMIGEVQLARMRPGSALVHTARGGVVDEQALCRALSAGHLAGAAIDVFEQEPLGASPLRNLDNVILTPHIAGITFQAAERMADRSLHNVLAFLAGQAPADLLNPEALKRRRPAADLQLRG